MCVCLRATSMSPISQPDLVMFLWLKLIYTSVIQMSIILSLTNIGLSIILIPVRAVGPSVMNYWKKRQFPSRANYPSPYPLQDPKNNPEWKWTSRIDYNSSVSGRSRGQGHLVNTTDCLQNPAQLMLKMWRSFISNFTYVLESISVYNYLLRILVPGVLRVLSLFEHNCFEDNVLVKDVESRSRPKMAVKYSARAFAEKLNYYSAFWFWITIAGQFFQNRIKVFTSRRNHYHTAENLVYAVKNWNYWPILSWEQ